VPTETIQNIQALRGVAVLLVVFLHIMGMELTYSQNDLVIPNFFELGNSGVDLFFVISGFVMVAVTREAYQRTKKVQQFLYHRITRIYPLYWFYSSLVLSVYIIQPASINTDHGNFVNIIYSYLLLPQDHNTLVPVGWTLVHEMYFYFAFTLLLLLPKKKFFFWLIIWGCCVIIANINSNGINNHFFIIYTHPLTLEFIGGCLVAVMYYSQPMIGKAVFVALLSFSLWILGYCFYQELVVAFGEWTRTLAYGLPAMVAVYAGLLFEKREGIILPRWLRNTGDASYSIYLSHILVITVIGKVWATFATKGYMDNLIVIFVTTAAVFIIGFLSYYLVEKKC